MEKSCGDFPKSVDRFRYAEVAVISKQAEAFWALLRSFPKQIEMPLSKARESDLLAEVSQRTKRS